MKCMRWTMAVPVVLLMVTAGCGGGDNSGGDDGDEGGGGKKYSLAMKYEKGDVEVVTVTDSSRTVTETDMGNEIQEKTQKKVKRTEILEVDEEGYPTKARVTWPSATIEATRNKRGSEEMGEPSERELPLTDTSILYERDGADFKSTLEGGEARSESVQKELNKVDPFLVPFLPEKKVAVGDEWKAKEEDLLRFLPSEGPMKVNSATATMNAVEVVEKDGKAEMLKVTFDMKIDAKLMNEGLGNPPVDLGMKGHFLWNIEAGRPHYFEVAQNSSFEGSMETRDGTVNFTSTTKGTTRRNFKFE